GLIQQGVGYLASLQGIFQKLFRVIDFTRFSQALTSEHFVRIFLVLFMSVILVGCSPDYNWRTTTLGAGEVTGFFPDKPLVQQRVLDFSGQKITFSLTTATVDGAVF